MLLNEMELFYTVVKLKSFSKAAKKLNVSSAFISKHIAKLEKTLEMKLLSRSTRRLQLTEAGEAFYRHCANVMAEAEKSLATAAHFQEKPHGILKISAPPALGIYLLIPIITKFLKTYPDIVINLQLNDKIIDIIDEGFDLALRAGKLKDSNLIAQRLLVSENVIVGTKKYYKIHGKPHKPADLIHHYFALYDSGKINTTLIFNRKNHKESVKIKHICLTNQMEVIKRLVENDLCLGSLPDIFVTNDLAQGKLETCLSDYHLPTNTLYAVYPHQDYLPLKVKLFIELLKTHFAKEK